MLGRGFFRAETSNTVRQLSDLAQKIASAPDRQTKRDKGIAATKGQKGREIFDSQRGESGRRQQHGQATPLFLVCSAGQQTKSLGITVGDNPVATTWRSRYCSYLQAANASGSCVVAKDGRGFLHEFAGIYKSLQNTEPFCRKMRGFAGRCKAQFVIFGTFCEKMRGFVNECIPIFVTRVSGNVLRQ